MSIFFYVPQYFTTQLSVAGGIDDTQTTGIVLQDISGVDATKPGIIALTWSNPIDTSKIEYIFYTSINSTTKELQGVTRGQEGYSAKSHLNGATVAWPLSKSHINNLNDSINPALNTNGVYNNSLAYNCIINGGFTVNQRVYVSNATLAAGAYGHDRWKAGASGGDYTFTQLAQATTITIKTGKSLIQVIEDKNVIGGTYTLSWTGTAQARFGINSATPSGAYAASPITITTQTAGTVMSVEFNEGTLGQVSLANSSVALPFMPKSYAQELQDCLRYCYGITTVETQENITINGVANSTTNTAMPYSFPIEMFKIPTLTATGSDWKLTDWTASIDVTTLQLSTVTTVHSKHTVILEAIVSSGLTQFRPYSLIADGTTGRKIIFDAEL